MATSYTTSLRLSKQGTGDNPNTWGVVLNDEVINLLDEAVAGMASISLTGSGDYTLSTTNGGSDEARNVILKFTGTPTADRNVITPAVEKIYLIDATPLTTGTTYNITVKPSGGGTGVAVNANHRKVLYCDGTNIYEVASNVPTSIGADTVNTSAIVSAAVTFAKMVQSTSKGLIGYVSSATSVSPSQLTMGDYIDIVGTEVSVSVPPESYATTTSAGIIKVATTAQASVGTDASAAVTSRLIIEHPGVAKAWVRYSLSAQTISASYNVASVTRNSLGTFTVTLSRAASSAGAVAAVGTADDDAGGAYTLSGRTTGTTTWAGRVRDAVNAVFADVDHVNLSFFYR